MKEITDKIIMKEITDLWFPNNENNFKIMKEITDLGFQNNENNFKIMKEIIDLGFQNTVAWEKYNIFRDSEAQL